MRITNELRNRVAMLRAAGVTQEQIADAVGCSVLTLAQYFSWEQNEGKAVKRAEMIDAMERGARWQCHGDEGLAGVE
jgi:transcriptional regulator with XRE-family HTH domain